MLNYRLALPPTRAPPFPFRCPARNLKRLSLNPPCSLPLPSFHRTPLGNELTEMLPSSISDNSIKQGGRVGLLLFPMGRGKGPLFPFHPPDPGLIPSFSLKVLNWRQLSFRCPARNLGRGASIPGTEIEAEVGASKPASAFVLLSLHRRGAPRGYPARHPRQDLHRPKTEPSPSSPVLN